MTIGFARGEIPRAIAWSWLRGYKVAGRDFSRTEPQADERADRNKTEGRRIRRDRAGDLPRPHHCAHYPHLSVSTLQYPFGVDDPDAAGRRLSVRLQIFLRLSPLFAAVLATDFLGTHYRSVGRPRRRRRVPPAEGRLHRLH